LSNTAPSADNSKTSNGVCTADSGPTFTCDNSVPIGPSVGAQTIWAYLKGAGTGYNTYTDTLYKTNVYSDKVFARSNLSFTLTNNRAPIYGDIKKSGSTDSVPVKLTDLNVYTNLDLGDTGKKYACFFYARQVGDPNWRPMKYVATTTANDNENEGVAYNATGNAGCSTNFSRASVNRSYTGNGNGDTAGETIGNVIGDPITGYAWEFRVDVRESSSGSTPTISDTLIHSNSEKLNLLFVGALS